MKAEEILEIIVKHIKRKIKVPEMIRLMAAAKEIEVYCNRITGKQ